MPPPAATPASAKHAAKKAKAKPKKEEELVFWMDNKDKFPHLFQLALKHLAIPTSSVYSERLFSEAGNVTRPEGRNFWLVVVTSLCFCTGTTQTCRQTCQCRNTGLSPFLPGLVHGPRPPSEQLLLRIEWFFISISITIFLGVSGHLDADAPGNWSTYGVGGQPSPNKQTESLGVTTHIACGCQCGLCDFDLPASRITVSFCKFLKIIAYKNSILHANEDRAE